MIATLLIIGLQTINSITCPVFLCFQEFPRGRHMGSCLDCCYDYWNFVANECLLGQAALAGHISPCCRALIPSYGEHRKALTNQRCYTVRYHYACRRPRPTQYHSWTSASGRHRLSMASWNFDKSTFGRCHLTLWYDFIGFV